MPARVRGFSPGKLILAGEHAVVYGHEAVALAVDLGTTVTLGGPPEPVGDPRLARVLAALLPPDVGVTIDSDLPIGRGMGSSASLAVALVRAAARWQGREADVGECIERGFVAERIFHGTPSGIDHTVCAMGGVVRYRRDPAGAPVVVALPVPDLRLVVLDSGEAGDTAALVAGVRARRPAVDPVLAAIGALAGAVADGLWADRAALGAMLTENHRLLREIGVSTPRLDDLVGLCLAAGALGAKLAGAGGGGVVLALVDEPEPVLSAARRAGVSAFPVRVHPPGG